MQRLKDSVLLNSKWDIYIMPILGTNSDNHERGGENILRSSVCGQISKQSY